MRRLTEDCIFIKMEDLSPNFWVEFNEEYITILYSILFSLESFFMIYFSMTKEEFKEIIIAVETNLYTLTKKDILKKTKDLHLFAFDIFKKNFWYNEGVPRIWNKIEESEIRQLQTKFFEENLFIFNSFNNFKILKNPLECIYTV